MATSDEIRLRVAKILVQALGVEAEKISPSATRFRDLGAESIDLLDIVFRLEHEFGIKIRRGELFIEPFLPGDLENVRDGQVTRKGLAVLRSQMPYADLTPLESDGRLRIIFDLFTVDLLVRFVLWKLESGG